MNNLNDLIKRRSFLKGGIAYGLLAFANAALPTRNVASLNNLDFEHFAFESVEANSLDTVTVPKGFSWHVIASWGDPLWSTISEFDEKTRGTGESQEGSIGDNNDGMYLFEKNGRSVLAVNNEYCNKNIIFGNRDSKGPETEDDIRKEIASVGVSIFEIEKINGKWYIKKDSIYNRKITPNTPIKTTGPAAGNHQLCTQEDMEGTLIKGTFSNCGNGITPWGTYLTCEENFNSYFYIVNKNNNFSISKKEKRYGLNKSYTGSRWWKKNERFNLSNNPNEANRYGYIVEIDPLNPNSEIKKHTAMGRFNHENCEIVVAKDGQVVAYMGDDEAGEHLYKFVSRSKYLSREDMNKNILEDGELFVATFNEDGSGEWINLKESGMNDADICIFSRLAATKVGATQMDRPEWVAVNPKKVEAYCALTNNISRGLAGKKQPLNAANPRKKNKYGQIIRWIPRDKDHASTKFDWDIFVMAGNPLMKRGLYKGSSNLNKTNMFNSPDGLAFDSNGSLWIQTDGNYTNSGDFAGMGNNQMLIANTKTGEIKRFLVGPKECEITGITWSKDKKTVFVGIQHPGESNPDKCHFPFGKNSVPRSSIIAINRNDDSIIG
tara:strand:+ start:1717 stop:3534 length:1818 start_codon:yes stop_codon:yes gene_type:complete